MLFGIKNGSLETFLLMHLDVMPDSKYSGTQQMLFYLLKSLCFVLCCFTLRREKQPWVVHKSAKSTSPSHMTSGKSNHTHISKQNHKHKSTRSQTTKLCLCLHPKIPNILYMQCFNFIDSNFILNLI